MLAVNRHEAGGIVMGGTFRPTSKQPLSRHELLPNSNRGTMQQRPPLSPHSPPRAPSQVQSAKLSSHARSAKIKWESLHGEPCPYARPASAHTARAPRSGGLVAAPAAVRSSRGSGHHGRVLPAGMPSAHQQCSFGNGFLKASNVSARQEIFDNAARVNATFTRAGDARRREGKGTRIKDGKVRRNVNAKPDPRKKSGISLLEIHQRVINAALLEISRPREGPFENLGERLGGEHDAFTYCSHDRGHGSGGRADSAAYDEITLPLSATGVPVVRASTVKGKRRARAPPGNRLRPSTEPTFRTPNASDQGRPAVLPRLNNHEPWKIPLLRASWNPSDDDLHIVGDTFDVLECAGSDPDSLGRHETVPQDDQTSVSVTEYSEAAVPQWHCGMKYQSKSTTRDDPLSITDVGTVLQAVTQQYVEGDGSKPRREASEATAIDAHEACVRPRDENCAASSLQESAVASPTLRIAIEQYAEEMLARALRGALVGTLDDPSPEAATRGSRCKEDTIVANESTAMAKTCSEEYIRRGLQARVAQALEGRILNSGMQAGCIDPDLKRHSETTSKDCKSIATMLTPSDLLAKASCPTTRSASGATSPISGRISGTTTPMSSDSSAIDFVLSEVSPREIEGSYESATRVNFGHGTSYHNLHAPNPAGVDRRRTSSLSETIADTAKKVVEAWVLGVVSKWVCPPPPLSAAGDEEISPGCTPERDNGEPEKGGCVASDGTQEDHAPAGSPGVSLRNALSKGFLNDIVARRASLKPVASSSPRSGVEEEGEGERKRLQVESQLQREREAEQEANNRVVALRELENLVHTEKLDRYHHADFSRRELFGEGRHSVVYCACATKPGRREDGGEGNGGTQSAAAAAIGVRRATAGFVARQATMEVLAAAVAAAVASAVTSMLENQAVLVKEQAFSTIFAAAVVESVISTSLSAAVAALTPDNRKATSISLAAKEFRYVRADVPVSILRQAHHEVCMHLRVLGCAQIVALRGVWLMPRVTLLLEPMEGGSLHHFLRARAAKDLAQNPAKTCAGCERCEKRRQISRWEGAAHLVADAAEGLAALHEAGIVHRDVKSHNVILRRHCQRERAESDEPVIGSCVCEGKESCCVTSCYPGYSEQNWQAKLGDLGSAALIPPSGHEALTEEIGTSGWMSPEVSGGHGYGTPSDIFSLGVLIWDAFVCGTLDNPMCGSSGDRLKEGLRPPWPQPPLAMVPPAIIRVVERCWVFEPEGRPTAVTVAAELRAFASAVKR